MSNGIKQAMSIGPKKPCSDRHPNPPEQTAEAAASESNWSELFRQLRSQLDGARNEPNGQPGPTQLALTVVAEALAIGEAMSDITVDESDHGESAASTAVFAAVDGRYLDHRARALRSALHSIDDYIWWGGLNHSP